MKRYLNDFIAKDLSEKIVILTGARQSGKTTLSKQINPSYDYLNYDSADNRVMMSQKSWDRKKSIIIFDELHKMKGWKRWLKGVYDTEGIPPQLLVTGSARLDTYKKMGDSLAGRYFQFRLHPIDLKEGIKYYSNDVDQVFKQLWECSGFPEPFVRGDSTFYRRWRRSHLDIILRQDLIDLYTGHDIKSIETLVVLLKNRIGSSVSYSNLARDLQRDPNTIKRWLQLLEDLYIIFRVTPYHKKIARSLLKEPKYYFYDFVYAEEEGARLENLVACSLLKEIQFIEDTLGLDASLHYLRTKDGKEIDFLICIEKKPTHIIEVKWSDDSPATGFTYFQKYFHPLKKIQLVKNLQREKTFPDGLEIRRINWLANYDLLR